MPIDLSNPSGFSKTWDDVVTAFREVAIDNAMASGGNLYDSSAGEPVVNDHIKGPVTGDVLASQYAYPVVWSLPQVYTPQDRRPAAEHGEFQVQVVMFAADHDPETGFRKARELLARVVNNIEDDRSLSGGSTDAAGSVSGTFLTNFKLDFTMQQGQGQRAQLFWGQALFQIDAKRLI